MRLSRFFLEIGYNHQVSMFLNKNVHDFPKLFKLSLITLFSKKHKNLFLLSSLFFIFLCNNIPFFKNIKGFSLRNLTKKLHFFLLQQDLTGLSLFNFLDFFITFGLANVSLIFNIFGKTTCYSTSFSFFLNVTSYFNFFFFFNLQQLLVKYPECNLVFKYCNLFLHLFFKAHTKMCLKKILYQVFFLLIQLKLPFRF